MEEHLFAPPSSRSLARDASPARLLATLWRRRDLIRQLAVRDLTARHRASALGWLWLVIQPVLTLGVMTFLFSGILSVRWGAGRGHLDYAINTLVGLVGFGLFSECVQRSPSLVVDRASLVKRLVFPVEVLTVSLVGTTLVTTSIGLTLSIALRTAHYGFPGWSLLAIPLALVPLVLLSLGVSWALSGVGTLVRDVAPAVGFLTNLLFFVTPVTFPVELIPSAIRPVVEANPLVPCLDGLRRIVCLGLAPDWSSLGRATAVGLLTAFAGYAVFVRCRPRFADRL